jgi:hypothetical protein
VFKEYNGWNTGISVVNISEFTNTISIAFHGPTGNVVQSDVLTIPARGQEFIYIPATQDLGLDDGFVGSATLSSTLPFHAAVDQVKYLTGEAMSYIATAAGANAEEFVFGNDSQLAFPLIHKGSADGTGDTSGIQLFNGDRENGVSSLVWFFHPSGALAQPTSDDFSALSVNLAAKENATVYTMEFSSMPAGVPLSAVAVPVDGDGTIYGVSNNVNYAVQGDGALAYNGVNTFGQFRFWSGEFQGRR